MVERAAGLGRGGGVVFGHAQYDVVERPTRFSAAHGAAPYWPFTLLGHGQRFARPRGVGAHLVRAS